MDSCWGLKSLSYRDLPQGCSRKKWPVCVMCFYFRYMVVEPCKLRGSHQPTITLPYSFLSKHKLHRMFINLLNHTLKHTLKLLIHRQRLTVSKYQRIIGDGAAQSEAWKQGAQCITMLATTVVLALCVGQHPSCSLMAGIDLTCLWSWSAVESKTTWSSLGPCWAVNLKAVDSWSCSAHCVCLLLLESR